MAYFSTPQEKPYTRCWENYTKKKSEISNLYFMAF